MVDTSDREFFYSFLEWILLKHLLSSHESKKLPSNSHLSRTVCGVAFLPAVVVVGGLS